ncbi:formate dehydrogenase accessory sulfurtransferase FdhD [Chloroflexota bacterium]
MRKQESDMANITVALRSEQKSTKKMDNKVEKISILRLTEEDKSNIEDVVAREFPLTIILNNQELVTLLCSPTDLKYLAIGFLSSEGLLKSKGEIKKIIVDERTGVARVETEESHELARDVLFKRLITSGCGGGASFHTATDATIQKVESQVELLTHDIFTMISDFQHRSEVFRATGGVHSAAICDTKSILIFNEDIGRHNAIDKIFGECVLKDIPTDDRIIITSGRISSEILLKVARRNIPILISKSAPTNLGVRLANDLGITLLGFVRGKRMNAYTNNWRIMRDGK